MTTHIAFAWEIGSGFGHLTPISNLGSELIRRGFRVSAIIPARSGGRRMLEPQGVEVFDAPEQDPPPRASPLSFNYAANLLRNGYWHGPTVTRRLTDWQELLDRLQPDLLLTDHAPAPLLVSRGAPYPRAAIGNGFTLPPLRAPMPSLQPWFPLAEIRLAGLEQRFLDAVNPVLDELSIAPLTDVASLFDGVERFICIERELDHYTDRATEEFLGSIDPHQVLPAPPIEADESPVFVYLPAHNRFLNSVLAALRTRNIPTLAYVAGGQGLAEAEPPSSPIRYLTGLVELRDLANRCPLAITHGGTLTAALFLRQGTKLLICPQDLEKALLARRLVERNLAHATNWFSADDDQPEARLDAILDSPPPMGLAAFAARYRHDRPAANVGTIADRLVQLTSGELR